MRCNIFWRVILRFGPGLLVLALAVAGWSRGEASPPPAHGGPMVGQVDASREGVDGFVEEATLLASDGAAGDGFGLSVAVSGDRVVVGARLDDDNGTDSGSAYVFERAPDGSWLEAAKLSASDGAAGDDFGRSVAVSGDRVVVGAHEDDDNGSGSGSAYVFERAPDGSWFEAAKLTASDGAADDDFGWSVAIDGERAVVTADHQGDLSPSVYVFERSPDGSWLEAANLVVRDGGKIIRSAALDGARLVLGVPFGLADFGAAFVFALAADGSWLGKARFTSSDQDSLFGFSVGISGETVVVGGPLTGAFNGAGAAYVFERDELGQWTEVELMGDQGSSPHLFGWGVGISNERIVVGQPGPPHGGSAFVFGRDDRGQWVNKLRLRPSDIEDFDTFGSAVAIDGDRIVVGSPEDDDLGDAAGSAYVFFFDSGLRNADWNR